MFIKMKIKTTLLLIWLMITSGLAGQEIPEIYQQRNEVYFSFQVANHQEIGGLTRMISIDRVDGNKVTAYANMAGYLKFMKLGYEVTLLPIPGFGPGVVMKDDVKLSPATVWNFYPTYENYESLMAQFQTAYPSICNLDTITTLASGRRLLIVKISDNVNIDEGEPEFLYTSSIHGDETTGYILMMHLIDYLLTNYATNAEAADLVNTMEIWICPLANPDGTYYGGNSSVSGARRANINGVDMNRNYPDPQAGQHPDGNAWQPETIAFMNFASQHHFVAGANFHGGAEVVNYPWDTWAQLHPDDAWWIYTAREYADTVHLHAPAGYMDGYNNGITNGYAWYQVEGGRQDYMNYYRHCREETIEISDTKLLPANLLETYWGYNWRSFILWMKQARYGFHGTITDQTTGLPVAAKVFITSHDANGSEVYSSANPGDYHRPIKAGTWTMEVSSPCYQTQTFTGLTIADKTTVIKNVQLVPGPAAAVTTAAVTGITSTTAVSGGNVTCTGNTAVTARGVCWGTAANPVVTGNHTTDGSGIGTFTSQITGLSANTTYHVRAYATNTSGNYYGDDITFTTSCDVITVFPYTQGFENAGAIPNCWTQEQVNSSGVNWIFQTGGVSGHPATAHSGTYNALLKDNSSADNKTRLIAPPLNLTGVPGPELKFWHTQPAWGGDQDQLSIYYKTSASGTWTLITTYTADIPGWTQETIVLPNPSAAYYIAFEGNARYGYGVCVDDVEIIAGCTNPLPVSVSITASATTVCAGINVTFTATPTNGGTSPAYQWKVNGSNAGTNSAQFTYAPANGDLVSCLLTSNANCVTNNPASSNTVTMTVNPSPQVNISISASSNPVCAGNNVTLTATPMNEGTSPVYQWKVNGTNAGTNSAQYTYVPSNGDQVYCILTSNVACGTNNPATSNMIIMTVLDSQPAGVSISASSNPACTGTSVIFTAAPTNGGTNPSYQWKVNGTNAGSNSAQFIYAPANGDQVICVMTSNAPCITNPQATSNTVTMTMTESLPVSLFVTVSANPACAGASVTFTATPANGGTFPIYQWKVNGANAGVNNAQFAYVPANNDQISCILTSSEPCATGNPATSNTVSMTINPLLEVSVTIEPSSNPVNAGVPVTFIATPVNGGIAPSYQWKVNNANAGTNSNSYTYVPSEGDEVYCIMTSGETCTVMNPVSSNLIIMSVITGNIDLTVKNEGSFFTVYPNPTSGNMVIEFTGKDAGEVTAELFGMTGERLSVSTFNDRQKHHLSLTGRPAGIYLLKVTTENRSGTTRIVKLE